MLKLRVTNAKAVLIVHGAIVQTLKKIAILSLSQLKRLTIQLQLRQIQQRRQMSQELAPTISVVVQHVDQDVVAADAVKQPQLPQQRFRWPAS